MRWLISIFESEVIFMVNSITPTTSTPSAQASMQKDMGLTSTDFLNMFVAQLQNQDPTAPQDPSQMLSQLSQMTQVEQAYDTNTNLQSLLTAQNTTNGLNAASLIGGTVTANGNSVAFNGSSAASLKYNLSGASATSTITISNASGNTVKTATVGAQSAGNNTFTWDGTNNSGTVVPAGSYTFAVSSTSAGGSAVTATTYTTGVVDGMAMVSGTPNLTIGSVSVALPDILNVN
jgi:flagellar basal-body rod modification protein FlgD